MIEVELLLAIPMLAAMACFILTKRRAVEATAVLAAGAIFALSIWIGWTVFSDGPVQYSFWYIDELSAFMMTLISLIGLMATSYSVSYIGHDYEEREIGITKLRHYYMMVLIFIVTMLLVVVSDNLGIMWIAIEATTLASAFLVGFYEKDTSVEASWKYIVICSLGIALALFGIVLTYASSIGVLGESSDALNWSQLVKVAPMLDPAFLKIAFIFIVIGYGTKVGLVPMHTWLPDAHSQAPTPISALMSGVLLNVAFYGIMRFFIIMQIRVPGFASDILLIFGILSMALAAAFILVAKDFKRLLAYSSIEHMGIISIGLGLGGFLGIFGALFHMLNHSLTKCMMFLGAGNIMQKYSTRSIDEVRGLASVMPITATIFLLGALAITGSPPFGMFLSEVIILQAGLSSSQFLVTVIYLILMLAVFAGFMYHVSRMVFGQPTEGVVKGEIHYASLLPMLILLGTILIIGLLFPQSLTDVLTEVARVFPGGGQ